MATRFSTFSRHFSRGLFFHVRICIYASARACECVRAFSSSPVRCQCVGVCGCVWVCVCVYPRPATPKRSPPATIAADPFFFILPPLLGRHRHRRAPRIFLCNFFHTHHPRPTRGAADCGGGATIYTFSGPSFLIGENFLLD